MATRMVLKNWVKTQIIAEMRARSPKGNFARPHASPNFPIQAAPNTPFQNIGWKAAKEKFVQNRQKEQ